MKKLSFVPVSNNFEIKNRPRLARAQRKKLITIFPEMRKWYRQIKFIEGLLCINLDLKFSWELIATRKKLLKRLRDRGLAVLAKRKEGKNDNWEAEI